MPHRTCLTLLALAICLPLFAGPAFIQTASAAAPENPFPKRFPSPQLDGGTGWLNTSGPITLKDLRGKVVVLDFWTYCCINCMHVLPELKELEEKYRDELVVIGVHSAKFDNEQDTENIREAIVRYGIEHPVINDSRMTIWRKFQIRSWPTLVLIDPEGQYCGSLSGEGNGKFLSQVIARVIAYHGAKGTLDKTPLNFRLEREKQPPTPLKYPGKLLVDPDEKRLFISDSNHNRIVVASLDGKLLEIIGNGEIGRTDGDYDTAKFDHPQGMELVGSKLYVADTENHLIRRVDLSSKRVSTLAGTGEQDRTRVSKGRLRRTALNSPWDLEHVDGTLYIAMAGPHQIWSHKLGSGEIGVFSGNGTENIVDGTHSSASYAQTSGIDSDGEYLYVCDSEGSAIRKVSIDPRGKVVTIAGTHDLPQGQSLFEFGDVDGRGSQARFQHPLGVALDGKTLFVADTYNHKIRELDLSNDMVTTWLGDGRRGNRLNPPRFSEPSGLAVHDGKMYIADTNNHRILVADLATKEVTPFVVDGLEPPTPPATASKEFQIPRDVVTVQRQTVKTAGKSLEIQTTLSLPDGYKLNKEFPVAFRVHADGDQQLVGKDDLGEKLEAKIVQGDVVQADVPLQSETGKATLFFTLTYSYCRNGTGGVCKLGTNTWKIPVEIGKTGGSRNIRLSAVSEK